jgi:hypothetical protein
MGRANRGLPLAGPGWRNPLATRAGSDGFREGLNPPYGLRVVEPSSPNLVSIQPFRASLAISVISSAQNSFRSSNARACCLLKSSFGSWSRYRYVMLHMPGSARTRRDGPALRDQLKQLGLNVSDPLDSECRARPALGILDRGSLPRHDPIKGVPASKSNMLPLSINISYWPLKDIPAMPRYRHTG